MTGMRGTRHARNTTRLRMPVRLTGLRHAKAGGPEIGRLSLALEFRDASGPAAVQGRALFAVLGSAELADVLGAIPAARLEHDSEATAALGVVMRALRGERAPGQETRA